MPDKFKVAHIANDDHPIPDWVAKKFAEAGVDYSFHDCHTREDLEKYAVDADVLWLTSARGGLVIEENMDVFKKAGMAIKCGSGTDNIDHEACTKRGIIVAHTPEDPTEPTSDHFIAMLLTAVRRTARGDRLVREGVWSYQAAFPLGPLTGADLGLIGFGRIGRMIVRKLSGFRMNIRVFDPYVEADQIEQAGCRKVDLDRLLKESRYVMVACPLTTETKGLIGEKQIALMRRDAVLVNVARAGIVEEKALITALKERRIAGAALDVLEKHPLQPGDEWLELDNVNFTSHLGGSTYDYPDAVFRTCIDVIIGASRKQKPPWIVNKEVRPKWDLK